MKKPIIGITTLFDCKKKNMWMIPAYIKMIEDCGGIPLVLPIELKEDSLILLVSKLDGILFSGGQDVRPQLYNEEPKKYIGEISFERDEIESKIFKIAMNMNKPIFAICRGYQLINVLLGGSLYQDLIIEHKSDIEHKITSGAQVIHNVEIQDNTLLKSITNSHLICVNSLHHQGLKTLGKGLVASSYAPDGLIESYELPNYKYLIGVQWHPERLYDFIDENKKLVESFIEACRN